MIETCTQFSNDELKAIRAALFAGMIEADNEVREATANNGGIDVAIAKREALTAIWRKAEKLLRPMGV